ncbi:MAG TPA: fructose-6-phosphate aldolase [Bacillota bacterium]|nr:MAG: Transaldolase [Firmicutes bacterium ADurb.Bin153]HNV34750.1 fructose-6-phosphate aldolase [Bacillota bacterium]
MKLFIDTANLDEIVKTDNMGIICGVTTNPTLLSREGHNPREMAAKIADRVDGPVSYEAVLLDAEGMVKEGKEIAAMAPNMVVKVPMTTEGLKAIKRLAELGIKTNATLIFNENQALLAARAGATYVSIFIGRLVDRGVDAIGITRNIRMIFDTNDMDTEIIAASIRNTEQVTQCAIAGAHIATVPYRVLMEMVEHPLTTAGIEKFMEDWKKVSDK